MSGLSSKRGTSGLETSSAFFSMNFVEFNYFSCGPFCEGICPYILNQTLAGLASGFMLEEKEAQWEYHSP